MKIAEELHLPEHLIEAVASRAALSLMLLLVYSFVVSSVLCALRKAARMRRQGTDDFWNHVPVCFLPAMRVIYITIDALIVFLGRVSSCD